MRYDKKEFKSHYGKLYFRVMYWGVGLALLFLQLAFYPQFFGWNIPTNIVGMFAALCCAMLIVVVPVAGFLYFDCKRIAKNQQQWIDRNNVFYRTEKVRLLSLKKAITHTYTYQIQKVQEAKLDNRYFIIKGKIHVTDEAEGNVKHNNIEYMKIPRCFTNEQKIMKVLRISA